MRLYLVRHGETAHNRDGIGLGRDDVPLNDLGREQAGKLAAHLGGVTFDAAYASPLARAVTTAEIITCGRVPVQVHPALIELDVGATEGVPFGELRERFPAFIEEWRGPLGHLAVMPAGERLADVDERVATFLPCLDLASEANVLVVAHNFVIKALICRLLGLGISAHRSFTVALGSLSTFELTPARAVAVTLNDTCHLGS